MSDETTDDQTRDDRNQNSHGSSTDRTTAPQSGYTGRHVVIGILVAAIGIAVTFGVPLVVL